MNELYHHGIKGQKWGVRRYQNKDGSLTPTGKKRQAEEIKNLNRVGTYVRNATKTQTTIRNMAKNYKEKLDSTKNAEARIALYDALSVLDSDYSSSVKFEVKNLKKYKKLENKIMKKYGNISIEDLIKANDNLTAKDLSDREEYIKNFKSFNHNRVVPDKIY